MSGAITKKIKNRIHKLKDTLSRKKELIAAGFMLTSGTTGVSSANPRDDFRAGQEKVIHLSENPTDSIVQDIPAERQNISTEAAVQALEERGAFFVDYEKFLKTGDVSSSIVYFTMEEMAEKGLKSIGTSPYDVSLARENHAVLTGDKEKDAETKKKAFGNIQGSFNGGYQFSPNCTENIILWGLIQEDNQEIKDFCQQFVRPGIDIEKDRRFAQYRDKWKKMMANVAEGKYSAAYALNTLCAPNGKRSSALGCLKITKAAFKTNSLKNPEASELTQQQFCKHVLMKASTHYNTFCNTSFMAMPATFSAYIHRPNSSATPDILKNDKLSERQKSQQIINRESGGHSDKKKLMEQAQANIYNKGFPELGCFKEWAELTGRDDIVQGISKGIELIAANQLKIPVGEKMYASISTDAREMAQAMFRLQNQKTL